MNIFKYNRGFTAYFAVLVSSLALAVGLTIYDLLIREISLSQTAKESEYAIFAADTGAECALYWDNKAPFLNGNPSVFGTSSVSSWASSPVNCGGSTGAEQDIVVQGPPTVDLPQYPGCNSSAWCTYVSASAATTTFRIDFSSPVPYCVTVVVAKWGNPSQTMVVSHGFNNCNTTGVIRLERTIQVSY